MNEEEFTKEIEEGLEELVRRGHVEKRWIDGEFQYKLTPEGRKEAERRRALDEL